MSDDDKLCQNKPCLTHWGNDIRPEYEEQKYAKWQTWSTVLPKSDLDLGAFLGILLNQFPQWGLDKQKSFQWFNFLNKI